MANYRLRLTAPLTNLADGDLDSTVSNLTSMQRDGWLDIYNGPGHRMLRVQDQELFSDAISVWSDHPFIVNPCENGLLVTEFPFTDLEESAIGCVVGDAVDLMGSEGYVRLTVPIGDQHGWVQYYGTLPTSWEVSFDWYVTGGSADAVFFYFDANMAPPLEDGGAGYTGYTIGFSEYHSEVRFTYYENGESAWGGGEDGSTSGIAIPYDSWNTARIIFDEGSVTIFMNDEEVLNYTDPDPEARDATLNHFGLGARTGGENAEHRVRNFSVQSYDPLELTTDSLTTWNLSVHAYGTIVGGGSDVTEYGFVYAANTESPTTDNHKLIVGTDPLTGSFDDTIDVDYELDEISMVSGQNPVWVAAYAINSSGTVYGDVLQTDPNPWLCLIEGTLITTSDGRQKRIEDIVYDDELLVWNFDDAKLDNAKPVWIMKPFKAPRYSLVKFSDGSELGTIDDGKGHRIFNIEKGMFTHMMSEHTPIGTTTYNENGDLITVVSKEIVHQEKAFFNIATNLHINMFANHILTSTGLNNIYPISKMKFVKDNREMRSREEFGEITEELFVGLRLAEQQDDVKEKLIRMQGKQKP